MFKQLLRINNSKISYPSLLSQLAISNIKTDNISEVNTETASNLQTLDKQNKPSILEPLSEDISHVSTYLKPTFNVAAYANKSETIQQLVKLGVNIHTIEKKNPEAVPLILKLNFDKTKEHIIFFNDLGLKQEEIAYFITKNPLIFKETLDDLNVRITYLKFKKFTDDMILRIVSKNPFWLSYSTQQIHDKLGFFQKQFMLSGDEVRYVAVSKPRLITYNQHKIKLNIFVLKDEMGFSLENMKEIIMKKPSLFMNGQKRLLNTFDYIHNTMNVSLDQIVQQPEILSCREKRLKERHQFLVRLGKDQFDYKKPNYIALTTLIKDDDVIFATEVAKSGIDTYNMFLKTI